MQSSIQSVFLLGDPNVLLTTDEVDGQSGVSASDAILPSTSSNLHSEDIISFHKVDIITPAQKLLARKLTCDIVSGKSLLVTG